MSEELAPRASPPARNLRRLLIFLPALAYMALITWLSSMPLTLPLPQLPMRDKGVHLVEYGLLGLLNVYAMRGSFPALRPSRAWLAAVLLTAGFGYLDELHQAFVPGRDASGFDLLADVVGAILGVSLYLALERVRRPRAAGSPSA